MPLTSIAYRLRIRNEADSADALVVTSLPSGSNPYILDEPQVDGAAFDPLTGDSEAGEYSIQVIDAETAPGSGTRVVTAQLANAQGRYQLLSRRAYLETSANDGASWTVMVPGFVTGIRLMDALTYEISIGDTRRIEIARRVFAHPTTAFPGATCLVGGPILGGWGPVKDYGPWVMRVHEVSAGKWVRLRLLQGWVFWKDRWQLIDGRDDLSYALGLNIRTAGFHVADDALAVVGMQGRYPKLRGRVARLTGVGAASGEFAPLARTQDYIGAPPLLDFDDNDIFVYLDWSSSQPAVGDDYELHIYPTDVGEQTPLHVAGHPVDIATALYTEVGIVYDSAAAAAARAAIGRDLYMLLRITTPPLLGELLTRVLYAPFGIVVNYDPQGRVVLGSGRIKPSTVPVQTITLNDIQGTPEGHEGVIWDLDEGTVVNRLRVTAQRYLQWSEAVKDPNLSEDVRQAMAGEFPADDVAVVTETVEADNGDPSPAFGEREMTLELPGSIHSATGKDMPLVDFVKGIGYEIFDRWGRGLPTTELPCLPNITAQPGEELLLDLPHLPNGNVRGGLRVVQALRRTPGPSGPRLVLADAGTNAQVATLPTFTLAQSASSPRKFALVTLTNAATLAAAGLRVRVEIGVGGTAPTSAGALLTVLDPAATSAVTTPAQNAGATVWIRMRSEKDGIRPGAYTAWQSVALAALAVPTVLAAADSGSAKLLTWSLTQLDVPVEVRLRLSTEATLRVVALLPPGSTSHLLRDLTPAANYVADVRLAEPSPFSGVSPSASVAFAAPAIGAALAAPRYPVAWAGTATDHGPTVVNGTFGLDVTAAVIPSALAVEVAVETAVGSNTPGAFVPAGTVPSAQSGRTRWRGFAPNDRKRRYIRARHERVSDAPSAYTATVSVLPWSAVRPDGRVRRDTPLDDGRYAVVSDLDSGLAIPGEVQVQESTAFRPIARGLRIEGLLDAQAVVFDPAFQHAPIVIAGGGGITYRSTGLAGNQRQKLSYSGLSASGFTAVCRIEEVQGVTNPRSGTLTGPGATRDYEYNKAFATQAVDDTYTFEYRVTLDPNSYVQVEVWVNDGAGWVLKGNRPYVSGGIIEVYNDSVPVVADGMDLNDDFGIEFLIVSGTGSISFMTVEWTEGASPASLSATAAGVTVPYLVLGL